MSEAEGFPELKSRLEVILFFFVCLFVLTITFWSEINSVRTVCSEHQGIIEWHRLEGTLEIIKEIICMYSLHVQ